MSDSSVPRLSVTVLNYNYARYLKPCLDSILAQTYRDFELILIDDCSKDDSRAVIEPYLSDPRVRLIAHQVNRGYVHSLLEGSDASRGEYLTVISADDVATTTHTFERQLGMLDANPRAHYCFSSFQKLLEGHVEPLSHRSFDADGVHDGVSFLKRWTTDRRIAIMHSGALVRRSAYVAVGGYSAALKYACDTDLWVKLCLQGDVGYLAEALYGYRIHASQMSGIGDFEGQMVETMGVLDRGFDAAAALGIEVKKLRKHAAQTMLFGATIDEAFRGQYKTALQRCRVALAMRPAETLSSRQFWVVALRLALGQRGYGVLGAKARRLALLNR